VNIVNEWWLTSENNIICLSYYYHYLWLSITGDNSNGDKSDRLGGTQDHRILSNCSTDVVV